MIALALWACLSTPIPTTAGLTNVRLSFVGDVMLGRRIGKRRQNPFLRNGTYPLARADWAFANLECALTSEPFTTKKAVRLRADVARVSWLKDAGIDCISVANNHASDCGESGLADTLQAFGAGGVAGLVNTDERTKARVFEVKGIKLGVLAYTDFPADAAPSVMVANPREVKSDISQLRSEVDLVIVSFHWGVENTTIVTPRQRSLAEASREADIVVGHGPHRVQSTARIGRAHVAFSLGDYVFDHSGDRVRWEILVTAGQVMRASLIREESAH